MNPDLTIDPCGGWLDLMARRPSGLVFGQSVEGWRERSRIELGLDVARPIIATGHQTLLWHPGILAKYLAVDAFAKQHDLAKANLIVDQHAEGFGILEIPIRRNDGRLDVRRLELCRPRKNVPMGRHEAFAPTPVPDLTSAALPSVQVGVARIFDSIAAHRKAGNAALQMADALNDLMRRWCAPMIGVCSSDLIRTSLARAMLQEMAADPNRCATCYNRAVMSLPEAGIPTLTVRDDVADLPLWRVGADGQRIHASSDDVRQAIRDQGSGIEQNPKSKIQNPKSKFDLLPRALFMTALVRLCMCDLFVHGVGGANYDRAMERWIKDWLGIDVGSIAVVTANVRLPLMDADEQGMSVDRSIAEARRWVHDPELQGKASGPGPAKRAMLESIAVAPRNSMDRRAAFLRMHEVLNEIRHPQHARVQAAHDGVTRAKRIAEDLAIAQRRDWAFPLYPEELIDELAASVGRSARLAARG